MTSIYTCLDTASRYKGAGADDVARARFVELAAAEIATAEYMILAINRRVKEENPGEAISRIICPYLRLAAKSTISLTRYTEDEIKEMAMAVYSLLAKADVVNALTTQRNFDLEFS